MFSNNIVVVKIKMMKVFYSNKAIKADFLTRYLN